MYKYVITFLFVWMGIFPVRALTNLFTNAAGDELWTTPGNWSLGYLPDSTIDVTTSAIVTLKIPNGYIAKCRDLTSFNEVIVQANGILQIYHHLDVGVGSLLTNNGKIILMNNSSGITVFEGQINNNLGDTLIIMPGANIGFDFRSGTINNRGYIHIDNPSGVGLYMSTIAGYTKHFHNKPEGIMDISYSEDYGIYLVDSLTNGGLINIQHVDRGNPNVPSAGIYTSSNSHLENNGEINISYVDDGCNFNAGNINFNIGSTTNISHFYDNGVYNKGLTNVYGTLSITASSELPEKGVYNYSGTFRPKLGGIVNVIGNDFLDRGIEIGNNITIDSGAVVQISGTLDRAIFGQTGGLFNYGFCKVSDIDSSLYVGGVEINTFFENYGTMWFENVYRAFRSNCQNAQNHKNMVFKNVKHLALEANNKFTNHSTGLISVFSNNGTNCDVGLWYLNQEFDSDTFLNYGTIDLAQVYIGIDHRIGPMKNYGTINIHDYKWGIVWGTFSPISSFYNHGSLSLSNQQSISAPALNMECGSPNVYTLYNKPGATLNIDGAYKGIYLFGGGVLNEGSINMTNITNTAIDHTTNGPNYFEFRNKSGASVNINGADYGVYFGIVNNSSYRIPFINEGTFIANNITNEAITGNVTDDLFSSTGSVGGSCVIDADLFHLNANLLPGNNGIGAIQVNNFQKINPVYNIQIKGNAGPASPNGHDLFFINDTAVISGNLTVTMLGGFIPNLGDTYTIIIATPSLSGTFANISLPNIGSDRDFELQYFPNSVKLVVIPKYKVWTGTVSTAWNTGGNWNDGIVPDSNAYVKIVSTPNQPVIGNGNFVVDNGSLAANFRCKSLFIDTSAIITFNNTIVKNYGDIVVSGMLIHNDVAAGQVNNYLGSTMVVNSGGQVLMQ